MLEKFALKMNKQNHKTTRAKVELSSSALHIHPTTLKKKEDMNQVSSYTKLDYNVQKSLMKALKSIHSLVE